MSILAKLFNSDKVIDGVMTGADKLAFTKEEKAEHFINLLKAFEPFKIAQRLIAISVTGVYLLVHIIALFAFIGSIWLDKLEGKAALIVEMNNESLHWPFITIVAWYFAGGVINNIKKK